MSSNKKEKQWQKALISEKYFNRDNSSGTKQNKTELIQSDAYNHDHGDNMVEVFQVITQAMKDKQRASSADPLEYASQLLRQKTQSGSRQAYALGLERAAQALTSQTVHKDTAGPLIKFLLGADTASAPAAPSGGDLLGSLPSSLTGGGGPAGAAPPNRRAKALRRR